MASANRKLRFVVLDSERANLRVVVLGNGILKLYPLCWVGGLGRGIRSRQLPGEEYQCGYRNYRNECEFG